MLDFSFLILPVFLIEDRDYDDCTTGLSVLKGTGATGAALGSIAMGLTCAATFGAGCVAIGVAVGSATLGGALLSDSACGTAPDSAELTAINEVNVAVQELSAKMDTIGDEVSDITNTLKELSTHVKYIEYTKKVREVEHKYNDLKFDSATGLVETTGNGPHHVKQFVDLAEEVLKTALDMIWDMIKGHGLDSSMYKILPSFYKPSVRQFYNMLFVNGYQYLYLYIL